MATLAEVSRSGEVAASTSGSTATPVPPVSEASASKSAADTASSIAHWAAPAETEYPDKAVPNPAMGSAAEPPGCTNLPRGALYRPARLPADYDDRLNVESIWIGLQKGSNKAVYFLPNACQRCSGNARFCDRGLPACSSCVGKPWPCVPGKHWATLRPKPKPRLSKATNYSAMPAEYSAVSAPAGASHVQAHAYAHTPARASPSHVPRTTMSTNMDSVRPSLSALPAPGQAAPPLEPVMATPRVQPASAATLDNMIHPSHPDAAANLNRVSFGAVPSVPPQSRYNSYAPALTSTQSPSISHPPPVQSVHVSSVTSSTQERSTRIQMDTSSREANGDMAPTTHASVLVNTPAHNGDRASESALSHANRHDQNYGYAGAPSAMAASATSSTMPLGRSRGADSSDDDDPETTQRAAKKRRLSHVKQEVKDDASTTVRSATAAKKRVPRASRVQPTALTAADVPLTSSDAAYFARIDKNLTRPAFKSMKHACPVWSNTRMALQASTEYFRSPRRTVGASVEIGLGGVARGVVLEGEAPAHRHLWGKGNQIGTLILPIGHTRPARRLIPDATAVEEVDDIVPGPTSPKINVLPDVRLVDPETGNSKVAGKAEQPPRPFLPEEDCIEALFMAQRAGVPVALAVTKDYSLFPFQVPRGICGLGWFFVVDSWTESSDITSPTEPCTVQWLFRFEFCNGNARLPWWQEEEDREDRVPIHTLSNPPAEAIPISGPGVYGSTTTVEPGAKFPGIEGEPRAGTVYHCPSCRRVARRVLQGDDRCVNEYCSLFMYNLYTDHDSEMRVSKDYHPLGEMVPFPVTDRFFMEPAALGLRLRGVKPGVCAIPAQAGEHGKDFWRGWICDKCGMANERRKWKGWECEGCKNHHSFLRTPIQLANVRNANRPICTGPRIDNGFPSFPFEKTSSWSLFNDLSGGRMKIVKHVLATTPRAGTNAGDGQVGPAADLDRAAAVIYHSLHSSGAQGDTYTAQAFLGEVWKGLQAQGPNEMRFKRNLLTKVSKRPFERYLCPYYTEAFGPLLPILTEALPHDPPTPWAHSPGTVLDWMRYINERASDMFAGSPEFNSLLVLVAPPLSVNAYQPKFTVQKADRLILTNLGSEVTVKIRRSCKGKAAEVIMQHGDVFGVQAMEEDMELQLKSDGFAFIGIARQAYKSEPEPGLGAIWDPQKPETWRTGRDRPKDEADDEEEKALGSASGLGLTLGDTAARADGTLTNGADPDDDNLPPLLPTTYDENPLRDWYMGPRPLDETQRTRRGPAMFERPMEEMSNSEEEEEEEVEQVEEGRDGGDLGHAGLTESSAVSQTTVIPPAPGQIDANAQRAELEDDAESLYSQDPSTPTLIRAEIPPSPTAPTEEDVAEAKAAAEAEAAEKAADKKAKRKKRQSEPAPIALVSTPASAFGAGSTHKGPGGADKGDDKRPDKKRSRASEPAPKETASDTKGKGKSAAPVLDVGKSKGKGKEKQAVSGTVTVPESNGVAKSKSHKRKSDVAGIVNGNSAEGTPSKSVKRDKAKASTDTSAVPPSSRDQEREKKKPRASRAKVKSEDMADTAFAADPQDGDGGADTPIGDGVSGSTATAVGTPVKLKLSVGRGSEGSASAGPSRPSSAMG